MRAGVAGIPGLALPAAGRWVSAGVARAVSRLRDQYAELLPIQERVLGAEHPDTLATRANLADCSRLAGDAAEARDHYAELLDIRERVLGTEHPDTQAAWGGLGYWAVEADREGDRVK